VLLLLLLLGLLQEGLAHGHEAWLPPPAPCVSPAAPWGCLLLLLQGPRMDLPRLITCCYH
jgi:hypothetical protein